MHPKVIKELGSSMEEVKEAFDRIASEYDSQRRWIIPGFRDFYHAALSAADWPGTEPVILDIGAGTGLLSALLLEKYPQATLTLLDISEKMLDVARERFAGRERIVFRVCDYSREEFGGPYDLVCSALSIHHLGNPDKQDLYGRIFSVLNTGGVFVNAEQVEGETPDQHQRFLAYWDDFVRSGPLPEEVGKAAMQRRDTLDKTEKLSVQLAWLRESGFSPVDVVYKNRMLAVMRGRKGGAGTVIPG
jgi:tRNA (cmo5U34)-methyltransferase